MKLSVAVTVVLVLSFAGQAFANLWDVPTGLAPGDTFRFVFATSIGTTPSSYDIGSYNNFVNTVADSAGLSVTGVQGGETIGDFEWFAIGSTPTTDARDNIGGSSSGIFRIDGALVADGTSDLFDGTILAAINITEFGDTLVDTDELIWTGSNADGTGNTNNELGAYFAGGPSKAVVCGRPWATDSYWLAGPGQAYDYSMFRLYAISEELTVAPVPVPGATLLGLLGLGTAGMKLRKRLS